MSSRPTVKYLVLLQGCMLCGLFLSASVASAQTPSSDFPPASPAAHGHFTPQREIDDRRAESAGIRKLTSEHLTLYTDLPSSAAVDELPQVFDQAVPQWAEYFGLDPAKLRPWKMRAFVMKDKARFTATGLIPEGLPEFVSGSTRGHEFWMYTQSSDYYRRHLLLHEGVHGFMLTLLGNVGPPWYAEGMAELLATHSWHDNKLQVNFFPSSADEVPRLGRIEIVQTDFAAGKAKRLTSVFAYEPRQRHQNDAYGWSWAAAAFLDGHPQYRDRFRTLSKYVTDRDFNQHVVDTFGRDWPQLNEDWQVFLTGLVHGYDFHRTAIDPTTGQPLTASTKVKIAADRGWQNTGIQLQPGRSYKLTATGRFQVDDEPRPWISEPNGVTIRYVHSKPLGLLLAAVRPPQFKPDGVSAFLKPIEIGLSAALSPKEQGTLFLKINDTAAELADNSGTVEIEVTEVARPESN